MSNVTSIFSKRPTVAPSEGWVDKRALADHFAVSPRTIDRWVLLGLPKEKWGPSAQSPARFVLSRAVAWHRAYFSSGHTLSGHGM